jgi:hypothetical protein
MTLSKMKLRQVICTTQAVRTFEEKPELLSRSLIDLANLPEQWMAALHVLGNEPSPTGI